MKRCYKIQRWYKILSELSSWNSPSFGRENRIFHWHQLYHVHFWEHITWTRRSTNVEQRGNSATNFKAQRHKTLDSVTSLLQQVFFNSSSHNGSSFLWRYISFTVSHNLVLMIAGIYYLLHITNTCLVIETMSSFYFCIHHKMSTIQGPDEITETWRIFLLMLIVIPPAVLGCHKSSYGFFHKIF